jgi:hypothetical protein
VQLHVGFVRRAALQALRRVRRVKGERGAEDLVCGGDVPGVPDVLIVPVDQSPVACCCYGNPSAVCADRAMCFGSVRLSGATRVATEPASSRR